MSRKSRKHRLPDQGSPGRSRGTAAAAGRGSRKGDSSPGRGFLRRDTQRAALVSILLLLAVAAVFGQTLGHEFVNCDDDRYVYENPVVQKGLSLEGLRWVWTYGEIGHWHPLTWLSHMLDVQIHGLRAGGHHLTNVLLHAASAVLLFLILWRLTGFLWRSAFVAALFAVHPLRAESVAWIAARKDVLSGLFFMLTLGAYVAYVACPAAKVRYWIMVLLFALGLLSKNMLVTLPFVLLLLDYWPLNRLSGFAPRDLFRLAVEKWPLFALTLASCVITLLVPEEVAVADRLPLALRLENAVVSYALYLGQMIYPARLACLYPNPTAPLAFWPVAGGLVLLLAISVAAIAFRRRHPYLLVGWLWYLGMTAPVIGIVQISFYAHADRYTYLPQIGILLMLTWTAADWFSRQRYHRLLPVALSAILLSVLMIAAYLQTSHWRDSESLWTHTLACTENNYIGENCLGGALAGRGRIDEAIVHFQKALTIRPDYAKAPYNIGIVLARRGEIDGAMEHFRKALAIRPDYAEAHNDLGIALAGRGRIDEAMAHYRKALEIDGGYAEAHNNLGIALAGSGRIDEAIAHYRRALAIRPEFAKAHNSLGIALAGSGRTDEAIAHFQKALAIQPDYARARHYLNQLLRKGR